MDGKDLFLDCRAAIYQIKISNLVPGKHLLLFYADIKLPQYKLIFPN